MTGQDQDQSHQTDSDGRLVLRNRAMHIRNCFQAEKICPFSCRFLPATYPSDKVGQTTSENLTSSLVKCIWNELTLAEIRLAIIYRALLVFIERSSLSLSGYGHLIECVLDR